jgi:hypothetical protein
MFIRRAIVIGFEAGLKSQKPEKTKWKAY